MSKSIDLIASYWTVAGDVHVGAASEASPLEFAVRVEAAAKAGFVGMGFVHADLVAVARRLGFPRMRSILAEHGIRIVEVEFLADWFAEGERRRRSDEMRRDLLEAAEALGARQIKVCADITGGDPPLGHMARHFRSLCDEARSVGARVALEIMPFTNLRDIKRTMRMLAEAGADNGGFLLDIWHLVRGNVDLRDIREVPAGSVITVELDDAPATFEGSMWEDTIHGRRFCGEGDFPIVDFLRELRRIGYAGPYGVEILSRELRRMPLDEAARRAYQTTLAQFAKLDEGAA
jgi:sugar phosphate isomerase/epimerase